MTSLSELELAYAAGYFDGEGSVHIVADSRGDGRRYLRVGVASTDREVIEWFHSHFGGTFSVRQPGPEKNHKVSYWWATSGKVAVAFLEAIYPYLRQKKERVKIARAFQALTPGAALNIRYGGPERRTRPKALENVQVRLAEELKELNKRGLAA